MGGFKIIEDRPTPKAVYNLRIYLQAAVYSCGALTFGYDAAFFGTTVARKSFKSDYNITNNQTIANLTSVYLAGAFFGAIFAWPTMERFGRRIPLQVASLIFIGGAILMTVAKHQIGLQYAGRVITGLAVGVLTAVIPTAISEISPPPIRGQLTGLFEVAYQAGSLVGFWINYGITKNMVDSTTAWRIPMAIQLLPGGLLGIGTLFLKESPAWLLRRGRDGEALTVLSWMRKLPADHKYIQEEVGMTHAVMEEESQLSAGQRGMGAYVKGAMRQLKVDHIRHRIIVVFFMFMFQNYSGALIINYYSPIIFQTIGIETGDVPFYTGIYGLVKAVGSFIFFLFIIDRSGRRKPWLISATGCALCLLYIGVYVHVASPAIGKVLSPSSKAGGNGAMFFLFLYSLLWSFGGNGLPWIVSSEMFPVSLRSLTGAFAACCQWLASFSATMAAAQLQAKLKFGLFYFFAAICLVTALFTFIWVPDTKAVPLECMPLLFSGQGRHAQWRQKKLFPPNGIPEFPADVALASHKSAGSIHKESGEHIERSVV